MNLEIAALSDVGLTRQQNEDAMLLWDLEERQDIALGMPARLELESHSVLVAVSDGMGGAVAGQVASLTALEALRQHAAEQYEPDLSSQPERFVDWLAEGIDAADRNVIEKVNTDPSMRGMGATLTVSAISEHRLVLAHVGDSRAYHLRDDRLRQLTVDHTLVQHLVALGEVTPDEAREHEQRHLLMQAVGVGRPLEVDRLTVATAPGDRILVCSDGLYDLVEAERIQSVLSSPEEVLEQCRLLIEQAKHGGGLDNISVIVAHLN